VTFQGAEDCADGIADRVAGIIAGKEKPTALLFASTIGEPESPGAPNASEATLGATMI